MTPREYNYALQDYNVVQVRQIDVLFKHNYEVARFIVKYIINMSGKTLKRPIRDIAKEIPFKWEKEEAKSAQTVNQMKGALKSIAKIFGKKQVKPGNRPRPRLTD